MHDSSVSMIGTEQGDPSDVASSEADQAALDVARVLFLCSRNAARSQMAEALLFDYLRGKVVVASAGASPAMEVDPFTFAMLDEFGIEWRSHRPKGFADVMSSRWDVVITLCDEARETCPVLPGHPALAHWSIEDPVAISGGPAERRAGFARVIRKLERRIRALAFLLPEKLDHASVESRLAAIDRVDRQDV